MDLVLFIVETERVHERVDADSKCVLSASVRLEQRNKASHRCCLGQVPQVGHWGGG